MYFNTSNTHVLPIKGKILLMGWKCYKRVCPFPEGVRVMVFNATFNNISVI